MASKKYKVASPEGADKYGKEIGTEIEVDFGDDAETERALIAAGWITDDNDEVAAQATAKATTTTTAAKQEGGTK